MPKLDGEIEALWARTTLRVAAGRYYLVGLPMRMLPKAASLVAKAQRRFTALIAEPDEVSLTISERAWRTSTLKKHASASGPFRVITFNLELDAAVVGYFAPAAWRLAGAGISIIPQCGFRKDHVLVWEADLKKAMEVLKTLIADSKARSVAPSGTWLAANSTLKPRSRKKRD